MKKLVLSYFVITLTACAVTPQQYNEIMTTKVKERAAFDFECSKDTIEVQKIGITSYGAKGCGKKASYVGITKYCIGYYASDVENYCEIALDSFSPEKNKQK